jgi:hypothetical protein
LKSGGNTDDGGDMFLRNGRLLTDCRALYPINKDGVFYIWAKIGSETAVWLFLNADRVCARNCGS